MTKKFDQFEKLFVFVQMCRVLRVDKKIEQKGMTFEQDFGYFLPLFSSLHKKKEEEKENE